MSDRLSELLRQRALLQEHLAWLDGEIAKAKGVAPAPPPAPPPVAPSPPSPSADTPAPTAVTPAPAVASMPVLPTMPAAESSSSAGGSARTEPADQAADEILEQYRIPTTTVHQDVRKGCLLYFAGAFVVLGIVVAVLYFTISYR